MKVRVTRPEKYTDSDTPNKLSIREGYYFEGLDFDDINNQVFQTANKFESDEVLDFQNEWGDFIGRFRMNREGRIISFQGLHETIKL